MQITINGGEDKIGKLIDHIPHKKAVLVKKQFVNMICPVILHGHFVFWEKPDIYFPAIDNIAL